MHTTSENGEYFSMNRAWPADRIERWNLQRLVASESNARTHSPEQIGQIAASMQRWGWTVPILVDEGGEIIAGHGRLEAARQLGLAEAPVMVAAGWSEPEKRAYRLADNQLTLNGGWDLGTLSQELRQLKEWDFDLSLLGFADLDALMRGSQEFLTDPDAAPPCPREPRSRPGDVWTMGRHRLICGDSTATAVVDALLAGVKPHLMVTDPPYGVDYDPKWRDELGIDWMGQAQRLSTHPTAKKLSTRSLGAVQNDNRSNWHESWILFPGNIAYVWHGGLHAGIVQASLEMAGFTIRAQIIWRKQHFVFSRGDYHWQHEPCWYAVRETGNWTGDRKQSTVWDIANASAFHGEKDDIATNHGTQKPVECMKRPIENNSSVGHAVYDPFVGSGTSIIAAEMTGRSCYAAEIDPAYVDVSVLRWQNFTGQSAIRESDGAAFGVVEEVAA
jgi:DNA modification methylase